MWRGAERLRAGVMKIKVDALRAAGVQMLKRAKAMEMADYRRMLAFDTDEEVMELFHRLDEAPPPS
jgi:hypothetical protein